MSEELTDIIVGNGVAAHAFLWTYAQKVKEKSLDLSRRIQWIRSPIIPACSFSSTSIVSKAGLQRGVSLLGDQLLDGFDIFENFFNGYASVENANQTHLPHGDHDNFKKRYGDAPENCYIVHSFNFLSELEKEFTSIFKDKLEAVNETVICENNDSIQLQSRTLNFDRLFLFLGAGNKLYEKDPGGRAVAGQYAQAKIDLGDKGFVHSKGPHNLIYRSMDKTLLIGSLDDKDDELGWPVMASRSNKLKTILNDFVIDLPKDLKWTVHSGVRHKGIKRQPFWGEVRPNVYSVHGLYKNGYSLSFLAAKELIG